MRARTPDIDGTAERDGVRLAYEVFGADHDPTVLLLPTWSIIPSRFWKAQVPYLARHYRVVTFDGRGCGRSDRPEGAAAYADSQFADDAAAVLDATGTERAVVVGLSCGASCGVHLAADHPERVTALVAIGPACGFPVADPDREQYVWDAELDTTEGWAKYNRRYWLEGDYDDFLRFFFGRMFTEPHSTKQIEDCVGWGHEIDPATLADTTAARLGCDGVTCEPAEAVCARVRCPVVVVHGNDDRIRPHAVGERLAELTGGSLVTVEGGGHGPHARDPVLVNRLIRDVVERTRPDPPATRTTWTRARNRQPAGALPVLAHRPRPRPARRGHRPGAAAPPPRPADRLARPAPGHRGARGRRRDGPPGVGLAGQRVGPHRGRVRRARPARLPGHPAHGRDPGQQLHGLPRRGRGRALRPRDRRRGLGGRPLPPREPRAQAVRLRLDDRLRRLAADARRRRPRGRRSPPTTTPR